MITFYHCVDARLFHTLWALEEVGVPYELRMLPFPPRYPSARVPQGESARHHSVHDRQQDADDGIGGNLPVSRRALRWPAACRPAVIRQMI
jgi:hypothetical protein